MNKVYLCIWHCLLISHSSAICTKGDPGKSDCFSSSLEYRSYLSANALFAACSVGQLHSHVTLMWFKYTIFPKEKSSLGRIYYRFDLLYLLFHSCRALFIFVLSSSLCIIGGFLKMHERHIGFCITESVYADVHLHIRILHFRYFLPYFKNSLTIHEYIILSHDANGSRVWTFIPGKLRSLWKAWWRLWFQSQGSTGLNVHTMQLSLNLKWKRSLYSNLNHLHRNFSH